MTEEMPQLSLVIGVPTFTVVVQSPVPSALVLTVLLAGQLIVGGMLSVTLTI